MALLSVGWVGYAFCAPWALVVPKDGPGSLRRPRYGIFWQFCTGRLEARRWDRNSRIEGNSLTGAAVSLVQLEAGDDELLATGAKCQVAGAAFDTAVSPWFGTV